MGAVIEKFLDAEIWIIAGLTALSMLSQRLLPVTIVVAVIFLILRRLVSGYFHRRTPVDWSIALLAFALVVTFVSVSYPSLMDLRLILLSQDRTQVYRLMNGIVLFYAITNWANTQKRLQTLILGVYAVGLVLTFLATISVDWSIGKISLIPESLYRYFNILVSDQINPNVLAGSLVVLIPIPLAALAFNWKGMTKANRLLAAVSAGAMLLFLLLSQSRSAWIAFGISFLLLVSLRWRWGWLVSLAAAGSIVVIMTWFRSSTLGFYMLGGFQGVVNNRVDIWSRAAFIFKNFPFSGIGFGNFPEMVSIYYPFQESSQAAIPHAHNLYLQVGLDLGITGLLSWLAIWLAVLAITWQMYISSKRLERKMPNSQKSRSQFFLVVGAGFLASQVGLGVNGFIDVVIWGMVRSAPLVWALWGIAVAGFVVAVRAQGGLINHIPGRMNQENCGTHFTSPPKGIAPEL